MTSTRPAADQLRLTGLRAWGRHGVLLAERTLGQEFIVDVLITLDTRAAAAGDDVRHTVDYAELATAVVTVVTGPPVHLIETLAQQIAEVALALPLVQVVEVTVHKPSAPIPTPFKDVSVCITRRNP